MQLLHSTELTAKQGSCFQSMAQQTGSWILPLFIAFESRVCSQAALLRALLLLQAGNQEPFPKESPIRLL